MPVGAAFPVRHPPVTTAHSNPNKEPTNGQRRRQLRAPGARHAGDRLADLDMGMVSLRLVIVAAVAYVAVAVLVLALIWGWRP